MLRLEDVMDVELRDDASPTGGIAFAGETVRDFLFTVDRDEEIKTIAELNKALHGCGIKPVDAGIYTIRAREDV